MCVQVYQPPPPLDQTYSQSRSMETCPVCDEERPAAEFHSVFGGRVCTVCNAGCQGGASQIELPQDEQHHINNVANVQLWAYAKSNGKALGGRGRCEYEACIKFAQGGTSYCIGHGGGERCKSWWGGRRKGAVSLYVGLKPLYASLKSDSLPPRGGPGNRSPCEVCANRET